MIINNAIKSNKIFLIFLFIFSFLIRASVFKFYLSKNDNYWQVDSGTYNKLAKGIANNNGFSIKNKPNFYRLPGYPFFISLYYSFFGHDAKNALWLQIILASFIPILIFLLSFILCWGNIWISRLTSIYSSVHLGLVLYSGFFMSESLFVFLFLIFSILFFQNLHLFFCRKELFKNNFYLRFCNSEICSGPGFIQMQERIETYYAKLKSTKLFFAGFFLGLASLVRPVGHYLIFLAVLIVLFSRKLLKNKLKNSFIILIGWLVVVFPWLLRNFILLGAIFFHTLPGGHFLHFSAARNLMHEKKISYEESKKLLRQEVARLAKKEESNSKRRLNEIEVCNLRLNLAIEYFKKYPGQTLKNWLTDILRTSLSLYSAEVLYLESGRKPIDYFSRKRKTCNLFYRYLFPNTEKKWLKFLIYFEILLFTLILIGLFLGFLSALFYLYKQTNYPFVCLYFKLLPFILFFIVIGLAGGYSRMRLPAEPFMIILSICSYFGFFKNRIRRSV